MKEEDYNAFTATMSDEFANAIWTTSSDVDVCGADVYTVVKGVFSVRPSPELFANISSEQIEQLRAGFVNYFEIDDDALSTEQITTTISRILWHWPVDGADNDTRSA
jgi:hypothetical protein